MIKQLTNSVVLLAVVVLVGCRQNEVRKVNSTLSQENDPVSWPSRLGELVKCDIERRLTDGSFNMQSYNQMLSASTKLATGVGGPATCRLTVSGSNDSIESSLEDAKRMIDLTLKVSILDSAEAQNKKGEVDISITPFRLDPKMHWQPVYNVDLVEGTRNLVNDADNIVLWIAERIVHEPMTSTFSKLPKTLISKLKANPEISNLDIDWNQMEFKSVHERLFIRCNRNSMDYEFTPIYELGGGCLIPKYRKSPRP